MPKGGPQTIPPQRPVYIHVRAAHPGSLHLDKVQSCLHVSSFYRLSENGEVSGSIKGFKHCENHALFLLSYRFQPLLFPPFDLPLALVLMISGSGVSLPSAMARVCICADQRLQGVGRYATRLDHN